jgi:sugar phosphate isomerase/epimerase
MKVGLVSYTYHRFLGEPYSPPQVDTGERWTMFDLVRKAEDLAVEGVVVDTQFIPSLDRDYLRTLARALDKAELERVIQWGNPNGLDTAKAVEPTEDLLTHIETMGIIGSKILRICGGSKRTAHEPHGPALERLAKVIRERCIGPAEKAGIVLAFENHWDYTAAEVLSLHEAVGSPTFKIAYDCGNALRVGDDPVAAARLLAPHVVISLLKDIGNPIVNAPDWRSGTPCVPFGRGRIDIAEICRIFEAAHPNTMLHALELDRPREDFLDEDNFACESIGYLRGVKAMIEKQAAARRQ